jgi:serine/threonine protein kinase
MISKDTTMFNERPDPFKIPSTVVQMTGETLWDEGPDGLIVGPIPFILSETYNCDDANGTYHQRPVSWAVKVHARGTRKLAYDFIKLASLQHPHVVQMFGAWEDWESEYVAMKMMQTNVMQFLSKKQEKKLSAVLLLTVLIQVAEGMSYMHSHHVRHHNLKCSNVLVGGLYEGLEVVHVEVSDYGLERRRLTEEERDSESSPIKNTVEFGEGDETDEYAFDVCQFALLCSELFSIRGSREESDGATTKLKDEADVVSFPAKCPRDLALYLQRCASKYPKERPKFAEICTVLQNHRAYMILSGDERASHGA